MPAVIIAGEGDRLIDIDKEEIGGNLQFGVVDRCGFVESASDCKTVPSIHRNSPSPRRGGDLGCCGLSQNAERLSG